MIWQADHNPFGVLHIGHRTRTPKTFPEKSALTVCLCFARIIHLHIYAVRIAYMQYEHIAAVYTIYPASTVFEMKP
ncbi:hypothetical protein D3C85_1882810 [compost metagenome]